MPVVPARRKWRQEVEAVLRCAVTVKPAGPQETFTYKGRKERKYNRVADEPFSVQRQGQESGRSEPTRTKARREGGLPPSMRQRRGIFVGGMAS